MFGILVLPFDSKLQEYPPLLILNPPLIVCEPLNIFEPVVANVLKSIVPTLPLITLNDCDIELKDCVKLLMNLL